MKIPNALKSQLDNGTVVTEAKPKYEAGSKVWYDKRERVTLIQRLYQLPHKGQWAKWQWEIEPPEGIKRNPDRPWSRPIEEVGTPNTLRPAPIPGLDTYTNDNGEVSNPWRSTKKAGRGRPEGAMNELKARNLFRNMGNGKLEYNDAKLKEALDFLIEIDEKFVEKWLEKIDKIAPNALS